MTLHSQLFFDGPGRAELSWLAISGSRRAATLLRTAWAAASTHRPGAAPERPAPAGSVQHPTSGGPAHAQRPRSGRFAKLAVHRTAVAASRTGDRRAGRLRRTRIVAAYNERSAAIVSPLTCAVLNPGGTGEGARALGPRRLPRAEPSWSSPRRGAGPGVRNPALDGGRGAGRRFFGGGKSGGPGPSTSPSEGRT